MLKNISIGIVGIIFGAIIGYVVVQNIPLLNSKETKNKITELSDSLGLKKNNVIGFLPYWFLNEEKDANYSEYLTTLTYFALSINPDGTIQKFTNPGESEPGWYSLNSGLADNMLQKAKKQNITLSLAVFNSNNDDIRELMENPEENALTMMEEILPIMKQHGFTDLNIDIESFYEATAEEQDEFTTFIRVIKNQLDKEKLGTLTVDVSPSTLLKDYLINVEDVSEIADYIVFMAYDNHYAGSIVTGPVSPVGGMGVDAEFDSETAVKLAKQIMPESKIILGVPLYGYSWETIRKQPNSATIPGSGVVMSNKTVEELLKDCSDCKKQLDENAKEHFITYQDEKTGTFHQIYYPDSYATEEKIKLAKTNHIGGIALWALGYEGDSILDPLKEYK